MRITLAAILSLLALYPACMYAQAVSPKLPKSHWEAGAEYNYIRTNAPPASCGCFSLQGGSASAAYSLSSHWKAVAQFGGSHAGSINKTSNDLTLITYLAGARYEPIPAAKLHPFGQVLLGVAHGGGSLYSTATGYTGSKNQFAMTTGGGLDLNLTQTISLRLVEANYFLTRLPNGSNNHQNNLWISAGIVFHF